MKAPLAATSAPAAEHAVAAPVEPAPAGPPAPTAVEAPAFVLRYACDDKYAVAADCQPGTAAWNAWRLGLVLTSAAPNLLRHEGGGPGGAEWNPGAPLVAFVASREPGRARLQLGARRLLPPVARLADYDVILVPVPVWNAAARPARRADLTEPAPLEAIRVVELRASNAGAELARGTFAFSGGE